MEVNEKEDVPRVLFFLRLLMRLLGVWYVLLGLSLLIGWNLNPAPWVELFNTIFLSFIICGVGLVGLRNWARVGITISSILLGVFLIGGHRMTFVESPGFFGVLLFPVFFINIKKLRENFDEIKEDKSFFEKVNWAKIVIIFILFAICLIFLFSYFFYDPQKHSDQGDGYLKAGKYEQAIIQYDEAIKQEPQFHDVYSQRALAYLGKGDYDKAIVDYTKRIDSFLGDDTDPYFNRQKAQAILDRARVYFLKKEYDKVWEDVHKVELLGGTVDSKFVEDLKRVSN